MTDPNTPVGMFAPGQAGKATLIYRPHRDITIDTRGHLRVNGGEDATVTRYESTADAAAAAPPGLRWLTRWPGYYYTDQDDGSTWILITHSHPGTDTQTLCRFAEINACTEPAARTSGRGGRPRYCARPDHTREIFANHLSRQRYRLRGRDPR